VGIGEWIQREIGVPQCPSRGAREEASRKYSKEGIQTAGRKRGGNSSKDQKEGVKNVEDYQVVDRGYENSS